MQKSFRQMEEEKLICSHTGAKSYMIIDADKIAQIRAKLLESDVESAVQARKQMVYPSQGHCA
ncbi:hypothetical protein [Candidatus Agathobaculum pullicola]|uniref:hypothetical protein n=1 Tax=Candidatus Agathobaculum pullicola TaxID=2838426 RepID=UPI003F9163D7